MNINLHNYEEFLLLHADNELSPQDRVLVEQFIQDNPELEEEFDMINSTIIEPDETFQILDKSFLLKTTATEWINEENYEEIFVLFHDGELTEEKKEKTIDFLDRHVELKEEFLLIGQAKIQGDTISFPDKKALLRKEHAGITGRIIMFRSLSAAAVLGFGLWIAIPYYNGDHNQPQIAQQSNIPEANNNLPDSPGKIASKTDKAEIAFIDKKAPGSEASAEDKSTEEKIIEEKTAKVLPKSKQQMLANNEVKESNILQPERRIEKIKENNKREEGNNGMMAQIPQKKISTDNIIDSKEMAHVDLNITPQAIEKNYTAQNVVYLDVNKESSENYIFYNVPAEEFKKTKVGGFLKKLKRVAERNDPIKRLFEMEVGQVVSNN